MMRDWKLIAKEGEASQLVAWVGDLERRSWAPPQLTWEEREDRQESNSAHELVENHTTQMNWSVLQDSSENSVL
jgi:hypothetical protein